MSKKPSDKYLVKKAMTSLGVYKPEFEPIIEIYCELREQYKELTSEFKSSGFNYSEDTKEGTKKAPIVTTLESLRKDILSYASQLGLTPQGLLKADYKAFSKKTGNALAQALRELNTG